MRGQQPSYKTCGQAANATKKFSGMRISISLMILPVVLITILVCNAIPILAQSQGGILIYNPTTPSYTQSQGVFKLPAYTLVSQTSWRDSVYSFKDFMEGTITFKTGFSSNRITRLNFNHYSGNFDRIDDNGDTVQLEVSAALDRVHIGGHVFYHHDQLGYVELLHQAPVSMGVRISFRLLNTRRSSFQIEPVLVRNKSAAYDRYYGISTDFFLIEPDKGVRKAIKPSFLALFPQQKDLIKEYISDYKINFNIAADIIQLLSYCNNFNQIADADFGAIKFFKVQAGQDIKTLSWYDSIYRLPNFEEARITYNDGHSVNYDFKMNYNLLSGKMDFIGNHGDTMPLEYDSDIRIVNIDGSVFLHDPNHGYLEILVTAPYSLGVSNFLILGEERIQDQTDVTSSRRVTGKGRNRNDFSGFIVNYDRIFRKETLYFFIDKENRIYPANKLSLQKIFPEDKATLNAYIRENGVDFSLGEDLARLISFAGSISTED
jgi:hypothetical protein